MKKIAIFVLTASVSTVAFGQSSFSLAHPEPSEGLMTRHQNEQVVMCHNVQDVFGFSKTRIEGGTRMLQSGETDWTSYGKLVEIMSEDFSKMATGSIESPDLDTEINNYVPGGIWWWNIKPEYTTLPNWGSHYAYSAGGCLYLNGNSGEGAQLNTPLLDVGGRCQIAIVQFKARTLTGTANGLIVEGAETRNMSPTGWTIMAPVEIPQITSEWKTFEVMFKGTGPSTMFNFVLQPTAQIYIDDIKVYQIDQYVNTPVTLPHSDYTGSSFKANWETVEGADYYLLNVYSLDQAKTPQPLLTGQKVTGNSFVVEGITSGETYYYTVRAVKGEHESMETLPVEVFDLEAPALEPASAPVNGKYTAKWNKVPSAERYNYWAFNVRKADHDGEFVVTDENFDGVKDAEGNLSGLTLENPSYQCYNELYLADLNQAGWKGSNYMPYTDYICVDGWHYMNGHGDAGLVSPELDLSKDGGKINLSIKLYGEVVDLNDEKGKPIPTQTQCAVALFNYDEEKGDFEQVELVYPEGVEPSWKTFKVTLTKGSERSVIGIYAVRAPGNLYMDDLKITQNYKKGESLMESFLYANKYDGTTVEVEIPERIVNSPIYHKVNAMKAKGNGDPYAAPVFKESAYSKLELVIENYSSIHSNLLREEPAVTVVDGVLNIANPQGENVSVYAVDGTQVFTGKSGRRSITTTLPGKGVYVVKVGNTAVKVRN